MDRAAVLWLIIIHVYFSLHDASGYNVVCYFESWWIYRPGLAAFHPSYLQGIECTHLIYAFTELSPSTFQMYEVDNNEYASYDMLNNLKNYRPNIRTLLAIGGAGAAENRKISAMARDSTLRATFVRSATAYIRQHNFDGLDVDWEFPQTREEKSALSTLLRDLRQAFENEAAESGRERLLLSSAVSAWDVAINRAYDVPEISKHLDFISVMAYDLHGSWQKQAGHNAPLRNSGDNFNVEYAMNYWLSKGAPKEKLNVGIPTYGRGFILANQYDNGFGTTVLGPTPMERFSQWEGVTGYFELCTRLDSGEGLIVYPNTQGAPYYTSGTYWIGYDSPESAKEKAKYIVAHGFAGAMVWALGLDDFAKTCQSSKTPYPIIHSIVSVFNKHQKPKISSSTAITRRLESTTHPSTSSTTPSKIVHGLDCLNKADGKYPDAVDCSIFYECKRGHKYNFACPATLCYDKTKGYCDWPETVGEKTHTLPPATVSTAKATSRRTTTLTSRSTTVTGEKTPQSSTPVTLKEFSCSHMGSGLYADPLSCTDFIWCLSGREYRLSCPKGLYFNADDKTCDWFKKVFC